jgi:hypothetical protein
MDAETAGMFADGFEETGRGMVARGWKIDPMSEKQSN